MAELKLDTELHTRYWRRCLKSVLPTGYTGNDSSRMTLGFFTLSALDLLDQAKDLLSEKERADIRDWILRCQHPSGGFCGSTNHKFPDGYYVDVGHGKQLIDPPNLPATFFAILSLTYVGNMNQVRRRECLRWLKTLQREDGSFGELITAHGKVAGGRDMRHCYVATAVRWMLRGDQVDGQEFEDDIDVDKLVAHIRNGQTYDGGISESSQHESHAGYSYCAIASLHFLGRLPDPSNIPYSNPQNSPNLINIPDIIHWLVSRQVGYRAEDDDDDDDEPRSQEQSDPNIPQAESLSLEKLSLLDSECVGFNGRCNKPVDTCYAFWVGASLDMMGQGGLLDPTPIRRFLFDETQHRIGGFGKYPGTPPDIYHSYLALAFLAIRKEPGLKSFDAPLCVSAEQREKISVQRKEALVPVRTYWKHGYRFSIREDDADFESVMAGVEDPPKFAIDDTSPAVKM